jgi:glycosyltransferase involved in cell wall biosynthesis
VEGLPIALLEAMSFGNCSLVSDIPENVEVIGSCGATFEKSNTEDLTSKLGALLDDPQRVDSIGQRAKRHVLQTYDWDGVAKHVDALYYSVLRGF